MGPFPINLLDARRLQRGVERLRCADPDRAAALQQRARSAIAALSADYPGDRAGGRLDADDRRQQAFFAAHNARPCPALDPETGRCELYAERPLTCRTYGPPLQLGEEPLPPCPDCFAPCEGEALEALRVDPDPEGLEDALLDQLERNEGFEGETIVAYALIGCPRRGET